MKSERINSWLTLAANLGVLIGIIFLAVEIRQNSDHLALELEFQTTQKIYENNRDLQDPEKARIFSKAISNPGQLSFDEGLVATSLVLNFLNEWEDRYWIERAGLTEVLDWERHVRENIEWTLGNRFAIETYESNKGAFETEFTDYVDSLLDDVSSEATLDWWERMQTEFQRSDSAGH